MCPKSRDKQLTYLLQIANVFLSTKKSYTSYHGNLLEINILFLLCDLREQLAFFMCHVKFLSLLTWLSKFDIQNCLLKVISFVLYYDPVVPFPNHTQELTAIQMHSHHPSSSTIAWDSSIPPTGSSDLATKSNSCTCFT